MPAKVVGASVVPAWVVVALGDPALVVVVRFVAPEVDSYNNNSSINIDNNTIPSSIIYC